ncbi:MAG: hypothetical protein ACRD3G_16785 [Vicinamibacterales bacterium]
MPLTRWRSALKKTYAFDAWPAADAPALFLHFWNYRPEIRAWPKVRGVATRQPLAMSRALVARAYQARIGEGHLVNVSVGEHRDGLLARETLLEILGSSMAHMPRAEDRGLGGLGEIAYAGFGDPVTWVTFVRGNLVVEIQSEGDRPYAVDGLVHAVAERIERRPAETPVDAPRIDSFVIGGARAARGARVPLRFDYLDRPDARLTVRLETTAGPFTRESDGRLSLEAVRSGSHEVALTLESADGRVARSTASLEVGP